MTFAKSQYRKVDKLTVWCDYDYNNGSATFDCLQLVRDSIETDLGPSDFWEEPVETDPEEDLIPDEVEEDITPTFEEAYDEYGNALTETTFTDGAFGTIYRAFGYNAANTADGLSANAGNDLVRETDGRGNETTYTVDPLTSRNEEVIDRLGHVTAYEYDAHGRTAKVTRKDGNAECGSITYTYDSSDNMTAITRGDGMQYNLGYNAFGNLESIGVDGKTTPLVSYTYRNGNGRLKEVTYANGDTMKLTYNRFGQITSEKWYDSTNTLTAHYKYLYDDAGNVLRSVDILLGKEYHYSYEDGRIVRSTENDVTLDANGMVIARTVLRWIRYYYDSEGSLTKKVVKLLDGDEQVSYYENPEDGDTVVKRKLGDHVVMSHSATDSFGRKTFDELQMGTGFLSRQFSYHLGEATEEHETAEKLKSSSTTQLVNRIVLSDGTMLEYEYDAEEHITKVVETSPIGTVTTTEYTYDVHGQLLTETVDTTVVNTMSYDNYGNIRSKNGVTYSYGDSKWKDLLTGYGSKTITYDAQGNPTNYLGNALTWSKGRQLKSFGTTTYTYNANGIRIGKVVNGVTHTYQVEGDKILCEQYGTTTITSIYDNEDSICGILYNEEPYFFVKNLQGDIIAITNKSAEVLARYTYDAWGKVLSVTNASGAEITASDHIAHQNPYRYRSYYYDTETELYYLQSRYYDPVVGRFVNADDAEVILVRRPSVDNSLYSYCGNNPVYRADESGNWYYSLKDFKKKNLGPWKMLVTPIAKNLEKIAQYMIYADQYNYNVEKYGTRRAGYINGQRTEPYANMKFASKRVKDVGCGTIAIYNALESHRRKPYYPNVLLQCYMNGLAWMSGYFGIQPSNIGKYFTAAKIRFKRTVFFNTWIERMKSNKRGVMSFWNKPFTEGMHTVFVTYANNKYYVYNGHSKDTKARTYCSKEELKKYMGGMFVTGYTFEKPRGRG